MAINRRQFLGALIGAVMGAALPDTVSAAALGNRYQTLIRMQRNIIFVHDRVRAADYGPRKVALKTMTNNKVDELLVFLDHEFNGRTEIETNRDEMYEKVSKIFNREIVIDTMSESELRKFENALITIATMRYLLATCRVIFDPSNMRGWVPFMDVYKDIILRA